MQKYFVSWPMEIFQFFAGAKKMVNGIAAGKNYRGIISDINFVLAEFACDYWLQLYKRMEKKLYIIFPCELKIG